MTDAELLRRVKGRDSVAWGELCARYLPAIWRYGYALVGNAEVAEDIVGETMLALVRGIDTLEPERCCVYGWLRGVARHKANDYLRGAVRTRRHLSSAAVESATTRERLDRNPTEVDETRVQVLAILDRLSDLQRLVLEWKYLEELSVREMADRLDQTEKSVESVLYRARREFRRLVGQSQDFDALTEGFGRSKRT